jgi:hypothetical protein
MGQASGVRSAGAGQGSSPDEDSLEHKVDVQVRFKPDPFTQEGLDIYVRAMPINECTSQQRALLEKRPYRIVVSFVLPGFEPLEVPEDNKLGSLKPVPGVILEYTGAETGSSIHVIPGPRVAGTNYMEMLHVNNSFITRQEGFILPLGDGSFIVRRPSLKEGEGDDYHLVIPFD